MQIELEIDGKKRVFTAPFVPMLAKRKYMQLMAEAEKREEPPTYEEQLKEEDELVSILADIVFRGQFTVEDVYKGASDEYIYEKLNEAIFGKRKNEVEKGNEQMGK